MQVLELLPEQVPLRQVLAGERIHEQIPQRGGGRRPSAGAEPLVEAAGPGGGRIPLAIVAPPGGDVPGARDGGPPTPRRATHPPPRPGRRPRAPPPPPPHPARP